MITLSNTTFTAGRINTAEMVISGGNNAALGIDNITGIRLSIDGTHWATFLGPLTAGTYTLYVRVNSSVGDGTYDDVLGWSLDEDSGYFTINIVGGVVNNFENISFNLAQRAATVTFNANGVNTTIRPGARVTGNTLDFPWSFEAERIAEQGNRQAITGATMANLLTNTIIDYQVKYEAQFPELTYSRPTLTDHLAAISSVIGVPIVFRGRNFIPKTDMNILLRKGLSISFYELISGSFGEILNRLIGWSDSVPTMVYNLYIKNGSIYIVQHGYEQNSMTPDNWALTPTLTHSIRHTQWALTQYGTIMPKEISSSDAANSNEPFSGTIAFGSTSLTYEDGYLITEVKGNVTTTYTYTTYDDNKYLTLKETVDTDEVTYVKTEYVYQNTGEEKYLFEEKMYKYDGQDDTGTLEESTLTRHVPLGGGWYGTTVYDTTDGTEEELSTNLSQGAPGQKASQYLIDAQNDALKPSNAQRQITVPLSSVAKARQTYPVADLSTLQAIANALDTYESKEEIVLQGELVGGSHIVTYDDTITFNGNVYNLISNNVSVNYNTIRQSITAVRYVTS